MTASCKCSEDKAIGYCKQQKECFLDEKQLISACKRDDRQAQCALYEYYAPKMFGVCKRYVRTREDAEDVLIDAFYKVFAHIDTFQGMGSFEGWIRRIVVNECLMFLRKQHNFNLSIEVNNLDIREEVTIEQELMEQDILNLLNKLPLGYRTVFNLYVLEGYKHREIADILGISINTSKSQLILAKERLAKLVRGSHYPEVG